MLFVARPNHRSWLTALLATTALSAVAVIPGARANPQGGQVAGGTGTIVQAAPNRIVVNQASENLILNWQSFNIGAGEQVQFQQPNAAAIAMNRITGGDASTIAGQLTANGQVWIVNPNGVFFSKSAVVNVAGLVATTSNITNTNFMAGTYAFAQPGAANSMVINEGSITVRDAGLAAFVAPAVANSGVIAARLGKVALVSGSKFTVDLYGDNLVKIAVDDQTGATLAKATVDNSGKIEADGGTVLLAVSAAESLVNNAINVGGTIQARTASMKDGKIVLSGAGGEVALSGTLDASGKGAGETGGTVEVLGKGVDLSGTAKIDVSGDAGGGTALIGGNLHGAGPQPNAVKTVVAAGATIAVDAITRGDGGTVAVWASGTTLFDGSITARGGATGGNGGYVETSGWTRLAVGNSASVDTLAPRGRTGTWLLDPQDITVATGADGDDVADGNVDGTLSTTYGFATDAGLDVTISTGSIVKGLETSTVVLQAGRDITVSGAIDASADIAATNGLTLAAGRSIAVNADITLNGGSFSATANDSADANDAVLGDPDRSDATAGSFTMAAGTKIDTTASISISIGPSAANNDLSGNDFTPGSITLGALATGSAGNLTVSGSATSISQTTDGLTIGGTAAFSTSTPHATIAVNAAANQLAGTVTLSTTGSGADASLTNDAAGGTTLGASSVGGNLTVANSQGALAVSGAVDSSGTGNIQLGSAGDLSIGATVGATTSGTIVLMADAAGSGTGALTINAAVGSSAAGAVTLSAASLTIPGSVASGAAVTIAPSQTSLPITVGGTTDPGSDLFLGTAALNGITAPSLAIGTASNSGALTVVADLTAASGGALENVPSLVLSSGGGIVLDTGHITSSGAQTYANAVLLHATATLTATNSPVTFAGTVDDQSSGAHGLTIAAGTGAVTFGAAVGGITPLASLTASGNTISAADIATIGSQSYATAGTNPLLTLAGTYLTSGGTWTDAGPVALGGGVTIDTTDANAVPAGAAILFPSSASTIDAATPGGESLTLTAGSAGTITLGGSVGAATPLAAITLADAVLDLGSEVTVRTSGGAVSQSGNTVLLGSSAATVLIDTTAGGAVTAGASIGFSGTIDGGTTGDQALSLDAGSGTISLAGSVGGTTPLGVIELTDATLRLGAGVNITTSGADFSQTGSTIFLGATPTASTIATTGGNLSFSGAIDGGTAGDQALTLNAGTGTISLLGSVGATTALGAIALTDAALDLGSGITIRTAGAAVTQTGATVLLGASPAAVTIDTTAGAATGADVSFSDTIDGTTPGDEGLTVKAGTAGAVTVSHNVGGTTPLGAISLTDGELDLGHNVTVKTSGGAVTETGVTVLLGGATASAVTIDTSSGAATGAAISFGDTIDGTAAGSQTLTLRAGTGGTISLAKSVGAAVALGAITLSDNTLDIGANVTIRSSGGAVTQTGATVLLGAVLIDTTDNAVSTGANVSFGGALDGTVPGDESLTVTAGSAGTIAFSGNVGDSTALGAITLTDKTLDLGSGVTVRTSGGAVSQTGATVLLGSSPATVLIDTTANGAAAAGASIGFSSTIDGTTPGDEALDLMAGTAGTITLPGNIGATTALGAVTLSDQKLDLASGLTIRTSGGAVSQSGATTLLGASPATVLIDTTAGGTVTAGANIGFGGTIDGTTAGDEALGLRAGTAGTITFENSVGAAKALGTIALSDGALDLGSGIAIRTSGGAVTQTGATVLLGASAATVTLDTTAGGAVAAGANVTFSGAIDGTSAGHDGLTVTAGTAGTVTLAGDVGHTVPLGGITLTDQALDLGSGVTVRTSGGAVSQTGVTMLLGSLSATAAIDTTAGGAAGAGISFSSTINDATAGAASLTLSAGTAGTITLSGNIGGATALGALSLSDDALDLASGLVVKTKGGAVSEAGSTLLLGSSAATVTIDTTSGAATGAGIGFGAIDDATAGATGLSLAAGSGGAITLAGSIGALHPLGALTLTDAALDLGAAVTILTSGGAVSQTGATSLLGNATASTIAIDTTAGGAVSGGAGIAFSSTIDGTGAGKEALALAAGTSGGITLGGNAGKGTALGAVTLSGGTITLGGSLVTSNGAVDAVSGGALSVSGPISTGTGAITLAAGGALTTTAAAAIGGSQAGPVSLSAATISLGATVDGGATLTLSPSTGSADIGLGGGIGATGDAFNLSPGQLGNIGPDFTGVTIATGTGTIQFDNGGTALSFADPLTLSAAAIAILDSGGGIATPGKALTLAAPVTLSHGTTFNTTSGGHGGGANVTITDAVSGTGAGGQSLAVAAGTGGTISLGGSLGSVSTPLGAVTLSDLTLAFGPGVTVTLSNAAFSQTGATVLHGDTTIATAGGGITFGAIDGDSADLRSLTLLAGSGTVTLQGNVGGSTPLNSVSLSDGALDLVGGVTIATGGGSFTQTGPTLLSGTPLTASAATITTSGGAISFSGTIDGDTANGDTPGLRALDLAAGGGTISLAGNVGASTALGSVTLSDAALDLAAGIGITTANGAVSETGATVLGGGAATTAKIATSGGTISFGAIDGTIAGDQALSLNAGTGTISLSGSLGAHEALAALSLTDRTLALTSGIALGVSSFAQSGKTVLQTGAASTTTIATANGAINFGDTIDGDTAGLRGLSLDAGSGTISLAGSVGAGTALGAVSLIGSAIDLAANAGIRTAGGAVTISGAVPLANAGGTVTAIDTTAAGHGAGADITLAGAVDGGVRGDQALTLDAGTGGTIALSASLGGRTALGAITLTGATLALGPGAAIVTASGAVSVTGAIVLPSGGGTSTATIDTTAGGAVPGAAIALGGRIDGGVAGQQALSLDAGSGTIALSGSIGSATPLGAIAFDDARLTLGPGVSIATSGGAIAQAGATVLLGGSASATTIVTTGAGAAAGANITFGGPIDGGAAGQQALTLAAGTGGTIMLGGAVGAATPLGGLSLSAALLEEPAGLSLTTAGGAVTLSGAVALDGAAAVIDTTAAGGNPAGAAITLAGAVDASAAGAQALTLDAGTAGTITLSGTLGGTTPLGAVTLTDAVLALGANITTAGAPISQSGATVVTSTPTVATTGAGATGAAIGFAGTIDAASVAGLSLAAGTGTITLAGAVGQVTPLAALAMTDAELDLGANVGIATDGGLSQSGATVLMGGAQATTTTISTGSATFAGPIDGTAGGAQALVLQADGSTGTIGLLGQAGSHVPLGAVSLTGALIEFGADVGIVTGNGAVSLTGRIALLGNGAAPTATGIDTTAGGSGTGANITVSGAIDGTVPGLQTLTLNAGASTISLGNVGATTPLGALGILDTTLTLAANATLETSGGTITEVGATQLLAGAGPTATLIDTTGGGLAPAGADVTFGSVPDYVGMAGFIGGTIDGTITGQQALTIKAGSGTISLGNAIGASTPLGAITLEDGLLRPIFRPTIITSGGAFVQSGNTEINGVAGPVGEIVLVDTTADSHPQGASITFGGTIDDIDHHGMTLDAGTQGTISLLGTVGGTSALGALTFTDAALALGVNVTLATSGGAVTQPGRIILLGGGADSAAAIDTTAGGAAPAGADITIGGAIDATGAGNQALSLTAGSGGTIALAADAGAQTPLGGLSLSAATLDLPANFAATTSGGAVAVSGAIEIAGGGAESLLIDATAGGSAPGGADITLGPLDGGAPGELSLILKAGTSGTVALTGAVGGVNALATLSLSDGALALGPGGVSLDGTPFIQTGPTVLLGNGGNPTLTTIDTTGHGAVPGAAIAFAGPIDGSVAGKQALTLDAGTGAITLGGSIGATTPLGALTFSDAELWLGPNLGITTAGGAVTETGITHLLAVTPIVLQAPVTTVTVNTAAAGANTGAAIAFTGPIDGTRSGGEGLTLNAGTGGTVTLGGNAGAVTPLGGLSLTGATIDFDGSLYQTNAGTILARGNSVFQQTSVAIVTVTETVITGTSLTGTATTGASITLSEVSSPRTTLTLDPGISFVSVGGGSLAEIVVLEGHGSVLSNLVVNETSLGGSGVGNNLVVAGSVGSDAAVRAFIRPGGAWLVNGGTAIITDPALLGLSNEVLNNEGIGPAIALMVQIQQLIARGDTGETAAQQAFDQYPNRSNYGVDPFHQRYNILGVAQQAGVAGFEDISYIQDGFWEGLLKK